MAEFPHHIILRILERLLMSALRGQLCILSSHICSKDFFYSLILMFLPLFSECLMPNSHLSRNNHLHSTHLQQMFTKWLYFRQVGFQAPIHGAIMANVLPPNYLNRHRHGKFYHLVVLQNFNLCRK